MSLGVPNSPDTIRPRFAELAAASHVAVQSVQARAKRLAWDAPAPNNCKHPTTARRKDRRY